MHVAEKGTRIRATPHVTPGNVRRTLPSSTCPATKEAVLVSQDWWGSGFFLLARSLARICVPFMDGSGVVFPQEIATKACAIGKLQLR